MNMIGITRLLLSMGKYGDKTLVVVIIFIVISWSTIYRSEAWILLTRIQQLSDTLHSHTITKISTQTNQSINQSISQLVRYTYLFELIIKNYPNCALLKTHYNKIVVHKMQQWKKIQSKTTNKIQKSQKLLVVKKRSANILPIHLFYKLLNKLTVC